MKLSPARTTRMEVVRGDATRWVPFGGGAQRVQFIGFVYGPTASNAPYSRAFVYAQHTVCCIHIKSGVELWLPDVDAILFNTRDGCRRQLKSCLATQALGEYLKAYVIYKLQEKKLHGLREKYDGLMLDEIKMLTDVTRVVLANRKERE